MKASELVKILKADGWVLQRHGSRHDLYEHPKKPNVIAVPRHGGKELRGGTLSQILKDAGLK